jgi:hypothetical protein
MKLKIRKFLMNQIDRMFQYFLKNLKSQMNLKILIHQKLLKYLKYQMKHLNLKCLMSLISPKSLHYLKYRMSH